MEMAFKRDRIEKTIIALVLDFTKPWDFMNNLSD